MAAIGLLLPGALLAAAWWLTERDHLPGLLFVFIAVLAAIWALLLLPRMLWCLSSDNWVLAVTQDELWIRDPAARSSVNELAQAAEGSLRDRAGREAAAMLRLALRDLAVAKRVDETTISWSTRQRKRETRRCWLELHLAAGPSAEVRTGAALRVLWRGESHWRTPAIEVVLALLRRRGVPIEPAERALRDLTRSG